MASDQAQATGTPRWFVYFVITTMGVAFTVTLMSIAWNNAMERAERDFSLASQSLEDTVVRNIRIGHNSINSLAAFLKANPEITRTQYQTIASALLSEHSFIGNITYCSRQSGRHDGPDGDDPGSGYSLLYEAGHGSRAPDPCSEIIADPGDAGTSRLPGGDDVWTVVMERDGDGVRDYWLMKRVDNGSKETRAQGVVAVLMDIRSLLGGRQEDTELSITLLNDSTSLGGRQLLYSRDIEKDDGWFAKHLSEDTIAQFPSYSVKLTINKTLPIAEIDKELVYNSLLIGVGVTMLMIALVRARDKQEQQLRERNIVIEKQVEEQTKELAKARDKALEASKVKSQFLASMSHEIRTPLNAIIGMSELLAETPLNGEQKKYTDIFRKAGDTLLSLVNDILDLSKIEAGQLELEEIEFNFVEVLEESLEIYALKAAEKDIELYCEIDPPLDPLRMGDPARLRQIILNLISNALKFTERGEIVVSAGKYEEAGAGDYIHFSVTDTGIGIPGEKLESIFESFSQVDSSTTRKYGGTGLGLSICRSLVDLMHGDIWVESETGRGSRFQFTARLPAVERAAVEEGPEQKLAGRRALIAADSETGRRILAALLQNAGMETAQAATASGAMALLAEDHRYDVVLADAHMADSDGLSLSGEIKARYPDVRIFLMTDSAHLEQSIQDTIGHNHDGYLVKPIKRRDLYRQITESLFREAGGVTQETVSPEVAAARPLSILLVDDNADNRLLVRAYLKKLPYTLDEAENGEEAVSRFRENQYDLVLMDVQMPVMDGREAARKMRAWEKESGRGHVPILALTAHAIREEIDECLAAGCDAHLSKPVKKTVLIESIQSYTA